MKLKLRRLAPALLVFLTIAAGIAIGNLGGSVGSIVLKWLDTFFGAPVGEGWPDWTRRAHLLAALLWFVAAVVLIGAVAKARKVLLPLRASLRRTAIDPARRAVIMGLSHGEIVTDAAGGFDESTHTRLAELVTAGFEEASAPVAAMQGSGLLRIAENGRPDFRSAGAHTWVQNLRALRDHASKNKLSVVIVCPSKETAAQASLFVEFLRKMLADWVRVEISGSAPDYNSFEQVRDAVEEARELAFSTGREMDIDLRDRDICIDATAGTAAFSAAAGIVTLNHALVYSYVTTFESGDPPKGGEVRYYDATVDFGAFIPEA